MDAEKDSKTFEDVALEEMDYIYRRSTFSESIKAGNNDIKAEDEFAPKPSEVFANLRANLSGRGASSIALNSSLPQLNGLSLSGGGIRSASFCLGVIEGLAELGVLNQFHYVSSVSGGGYAASWLGAWSYRLPDGIVGVQRTLREAATKSEPLPEIQHLSRYVTYLAPRAGVLSADLWSLLSAYFRNLAITLCTVLPAIMLVAGAPMLLALISIFASEQTWLLGSASPISVIALIAISVSIRVLAEAKDYNKATRNATLARWLAPVGLALGGAAFAVAFCAGGWLFKLGELATSLNARIFWGVAFYALLATSVLALYQLGRRYFAADSLLTFWIRLSVGLRGIGARWKHCFAVLISIFVALAALFVFEPLARSVVASLTPSGRLSTAFAAVTIGPVIWCFAVLLGETALQVALSRELDDGDREWMARFSGLCLTSALVWLLLCLVGLGLTTFARTTGAFWVAFSFVITLAVARILSPARFPMVAVGVAAISCLYLLGSIVSWGVYKKLDAGASVEELVGDMLFYSAAIILVVFTLDRLVNVNKFSMHALYRDRLVRTFIGASRHRDQDVGDTTIPQEQEKQFLKRVGSPFHDFDSSDNLPLSWLKSDSSWRPNHWMPVFLFNAALNRTWHTRERGRMAKAFSYSFSPFFCGSKLTDYCRTEQYVSNEGGVTLGAAIATSGAALSSRTGRFDNPLFAFFLTLINLRLGTWLGNPGNKVTRAFSGPKSSWNAYFSELFGGATRRSNWIHLSDGGHFENLGTYELIRRRCSKIVAVDSSADPERDFADLANLIRLARDELNVVIKIASNIRIGDRKQSHGLYAAIFEIVYPEGASGRLIYIKPSVYDEPILTVTVPVEVQSYAKQSPAFPHEPTVDQFFTSEQFDAYRRLGLHQIRTVFDVGPMGGTHDMAELFDLADSHTTVE